MRHLRPSDPTASLVLACTLFALSTPASASRDLTFEERVAAQEAIERVYFSHQIGATRPFEEAAPRELLENKVRTYLKQSAALEQFWSTPVTAEMLRAEIGRIARATRLPERLNEIYRALGDDPLLVQECFARSVMVNRLARSFFSFDSTRHATAWEEARELRSRLVGGQIDMMTPEPHRSILTMHRAAQAAEAELTLPPIADPLDGRTRLALPPGDYDRVRANAPPQVGEVGEVVEGRSAFTITVVLADTGESAQIATYIVRKLDWSDWWAQVTSGLDESSVAVVASADAQLPLPLVTGPGLAGPTAMVGSRLDVRDTVAAAATPCTADDTWENASLDDVPSGRVFHTAVWTGTEMIVWGGHDGTVTNTGGRYDPLTDSWTPTSTQGTPPGYSGDPGRMFHTAVWTGSEMIIWGGGGQLNTGGRYNPSTDVWTPTSTFRAPSGRIYHTAVWTGREMLVWGGFDGSLFGPSRGARYDPATDNWVPMSTVGVPTDRYNHSAVWTGTEMIVWGGGSWLATGGRYNPLTDVWTPTSTAGAPAGRYGHSAVWTGTEMLIWAGLDGIDKPTNTGGRYDPSTDAWTAMSIAGAPTAREKHTSEWTGSHMIVWGGNDGTRSQSGGRYDPVGNTWAPTSTIGAPAARDDHTTVWTGSQMIVWGGNTGSSMYSNRGGRYAPLSDTWTPTSTTGAPTSRYDHAAFWTGNEMIVWGGEEGGGLGTGGRYDALTDTWTPTSMAGSPLARTYFSAVWTGNEVIVWGGSAGGYSGTPTDTGGRYDPLTDTWKATATNGAPTPRYGHAAVWTGSEVVLWGGYLGAGTHTNTGARYDPFTDRWTPISTIGAPTNRSYHTAIWTGREMIVWGGLNQVNTGGRYDPATDRWVPTSTLGAPQGRDSHTVVWIAGRMIVWGGYAGTYSNTGGRYDPLTDTWAPTSMAGAPSGRLNHTAVATASEMIVWGGRSGEDYPSSGGRYYPLTDVWIPTSIAGAPGGREEHTAVWTGNEVIVWGGFPGLGGGRYLLADQTDGDVDGFPICADDCNDADSSVFPGAAESCDGIDNDCDGVSDDEASIGCDDHDPCNGMETCGGVNGCQPGTPPVCDDGNPCTVDACDPATGCLSTATDPSCREPKGQGYYKHLCRGGHPEDGLTDEDARCVGESATFVGVASIPQMCDRFEPDPPSSKCEQAEAQFLATLLNRCEGRLSDADPVASPCVEARTVGGAIAEVDALLSNASRTRDDCVRAQCASEQINSTGAPVLSLDLTSDGDAILTWAILAGVEVAPPAYEVWRRPHGTAPFSLIAIIGDPFFVDPASGGEAALDYEVTARPSLSSVVPE